MASNFKFKLLSQLSKKRAEGGFTLIELLVVVIIIGVLAAVALPNLLGQVGKARETEGKNAIGTINRAQQAYHFEKGSFSNPALVTSDLAQNNLLGVTVTSDYFSFNTDAGTAAASASNAIPIAGEKDGVRGYAGAVSFNSSAGSYSNIVCQADQIDGSIALTAVTTASCPTGSSQLN